MEQFAMGNQLVYRQFPPLSTIPSDNLPDPWKPGSTNPEFNNGVHPDLSGIHGYYSATGRVATIGPEGLIKCATGFMINPQIVLTAAHVIAPAYAWKNILLFQPAFSGRPLLGYEKVTVREAFIPQAYFTSNNIGKDYAILVLERTVPSERLFRLSKLNPSASYNIPSFAIGYPNTPILQLANGSIEWANPLQLGHSIPTADGSSGSAITARQLSDGANVVLGIHNRSGKASIVSTAMLDEIRFVINRMNVNDLNLIS